MDIKTQIQQAREKAKKLYPEGRAQAKRFTPEIYIPLCEQAAFIEGAEWLLSEIGKENEGLKGENEYFGKLIDLLQSQSLQGETERLKGVIEKAFKEGYDAATHHESSFKAWQSFKTEHNL